VPVFEIKEDPAIDVMIPPAFERLAGKTFHIGTAKDAGLHEMGIGWWARYGSDRPGQ
jgi:hypothetical protein